jgi:uncharacterized caspase-like protein
MKMRFQIKFLALVAFFAVLLVAGASIAQPFGPAATLGSVKEMRTEQRVALIIGNSAYNNALGALLNPANDASDMAEVLRRTGFDVTLKLDVGRDQMLRAVADFGRSLQNGGVGLFYYAGHAVQVDGKNYLIPLGVELASEDYVEVETVNLDHVLAKMGRADNRLNIVILDACRNDPFPSATRGVGGGLAATLAPSGTYIAYAAAPGELARDGRSRNSPYTAALLDSMAEPGLRLEDVFKRVNFKVQAETDGSQTPWTSSSITGDFYFHLPEQEQAKPPVAALPPSAPVAALARSAEVWQGIAGSHNPDDFRLFLKNFPDSALAPWAERRLAELETSQTAELIAPDRSGATRAPAPPAAELEPKPPEPLEEADDLPAPRLEREQVSPAKPPVQLVRRHDADEAAEKMQDRLEQSRPGSSRTAQPDVLRVVGTDLELRDVSECESFLSDRFDDMLRENDTRFRSCVAMWKDDAPITPYRYPGCTDPGWSTMTGPKQCHEFVRVACQTHKVKVDFMAMCRQRLASR